MDLRGSDGNGPGHVTGDVELLLDRVRRDSGPLISDWWIDENMTQLYTEDAETLRELRLYNQWVEYIFIYVYSLVGLIGIGANGMVLIRMCTSKKLRTPSNYFITNLAISDLIVLSVLLSTRVFIHFQNRGSGFDEQEEIFNAIRFLQHVCVQSTSLVLAAMSYTRYHFIVHPLKARAEWTSRRVWAICAITWIVSCLLYLPIVFGILTVEGETVTDLVPIPTKRKIFSTVRLFPMFIIPGLIILISYGKIMVAVRNRDDFLRGKSMRAANESFQKKTDVQTKKLTRMVVMIVLVFFLSWGPYQIYLSALDLRPYLLPRTPGRWKAVTVLTASLRLLAYLGCTINPFIYAYSNPAFLGIRKLKTFFSSKSKSTTTSTLETPDNSIALQTNNVKNVANTAT